MMTKKLGEDSSRQQPQVEGPKTIGLLVRGTVNRRWKKTLGNGTEVVNYAVDGLVVTAYRPDGYYAVGQFVELPVAVSLWQSNTGPRYNLTIVGLREGEF
jgi:hypothetical protein